MASKKQPNPADLVDAYFTARDTRLAADRANAHLVEAEQAAKKIAWDAVIASGQTVVGGKLAELELTTSNQVEVYDLDELRKYAKKKDNDDIFKVSVNDAAIKARWKAGVTVPGVRVLPVNGISLHKRKEKA